jgi:hypothetical protein
MAPAVPGRKAAFALYVGADTGILLPVTWEEADIILRIGR